MAWTKWSLLPNEILWLIIERLDFFDCHCVSAVCKNWRSACRNYLSVSSFPTPNDHIPWLITNTGSFLELFRPATNKSYKFNLPEFHNPSCVSKEGWLLVFESTQYAHNEYVPVLLNMTTLEKICLPKPKIARRATLCIRNATFSTQMKTPHCVVLMVGDCYQNVMIYIWKKGGLEWNTYNHQTRYILKDVYFPFIWLCDDLLYCFTLDGCCFAFDTNLNLKLKLDSSLGKSANEFAVCDNKIYCFTFLGSKIYKFDRNMMGWTKIDGGNSVWFSGTFDYCSTVVVVRDQLRKEQILMDLKNNGCPVTSDASVSYVGGKECKLTSWVNIS